MPRDLSTLPRSLYKYTFTLSLHFWSCVPDVAIFGSMENISVRKMTFGPAPQDPGGAGVGNKRATQPSLSLCYGVEFNCDAHQASDNDLFNPFDFIGRHC